MLHRAGPAMPRCTALPVPSCTTPAPRSEEVKPAQRGSCWKVRPEWLIGKAELGLVADGSCWGRTRVQLPGLPPAAVLSLPGSCSPSPSPWDTALLPPQPWPSHERPSRQGRHREGRTPRAPPCPAGAQHLPPQRASCTNTWEQAGCAGPCEARGTGVLIPIPWDARGIPQAGWPPLLGQGSRQDRPR